MAVTAMESVGEAGICRIRTSKTSGNRVSDRDVFTMVKDLKEGIEITTKGCNPVRGDMEGRNDESGRLPNRTPRMKKVMKIKKATNC